MTEFAAHVEDFCTRLFEDIRKLTADTCGVTREGYTPEEEKVHERLAEAAREIGLEVHADDALNLWMTLPGRQPSSRDRTPTLFRWAAITTGSLASSRRSPWPNI